MGRILVGTSSWTDPTLIKSGRFYPTWAKTAEARLRFYAGQFNLVEVDSSYYALPSETTSGLWVARTPDEFVFDIKAFRLFTRHPTPLTALPNDIRDSLPSTLTGKTNLYVEDMEESLVREMWARFESALLPIESAGKLGLVLLQFPPWFYPGNEQREYILACKERLPQYRIAVEFRHGSWFNDKNWERTFAFLRENDLPLVCVDEPQGFKSSVPQLMEITSDVAVVRFHGRNGETWEKKGLTTAERFNYLYAEGELAEWVPKIKGMAAQVGQLHVLFNNCYEDKATTNARQMKTMVE
jgi:uncharacterized protein YecE (DUF72 family)